MPKGLGLDWWPSEYGLGALGAPESLSEAPHSRNCFLNHTKMLFVFCLLILLTNFATDDAEADVTPPVFYEARH